MSKMSFVRATSSLDPAGRNGFSAVLKRPCISGASLLQDGKERQVQGSCTDSQCGMDVSPSGPNRSWESETKSTCYLRAVPKMFRG